MLKVLIKARPTFPAKTKSLFNFIVSGKTATAKFAHLNIYFHISLVSSHPSMGGDLVATGGIPAVRIRLLDFGSHLI